MQNARRAVLALVLPALIALTPAASMAQTAARDVGGLRAYWHVFIAYTIAIVLVVGWVVSIGRRLREVEQRLDSER
jgi:CcmD family protein